MASKIAFLSAFGSMVHGGGLAAITDQDPATTGYAQSTAGVFGVTLASPSKVAQARVLSPANGFDASGLQSAITIKLFGRVGAPPSTALDGQELGAVNFTDVNAQTEKVITSTDMLTTFDHLWLTCTTGVWTVFAEAAFYAPDPIPQVPVHSIGASRHILTACSMADVPLTQVYMAIPGLSMRLHTPAARVAIVDFHADVKHVGTQYTGVVGFGLRVQHRWGADEQALNAAQWQESPSLVGGGNIIDRNPHHYGNKAFCGALTLVAGFHDLRVVGSVHTSASTADFLGAIYGEYNLLRVVVEPEDSVLIRI